jgi:N-methylhydantoinase A
VYPHLAMEVIDEHVATPLGSDLLTAAHGIYLLANSMMARAIRGVTTERGRDPREHALVAYGGAGPMHAVLLARDFGMKHVIVPPAPGVFSATGLLLAAMSYDAARTVAVTLATGREVAVLEALRELELEVRARGRADGLTDPELHIDRFADVRYAGQSSELRVRLPECIIDSGNLDALQEVFHREHEQMYGHALRDGQVVVVNVRVRASDDRVTDEQRTTWLSGTVSSRVIGEREREAYFGAEPGLLLTPVIRRSALRGTKRAGPLIIEDADSTTVIPPLATATIGRLGELLIETGA